MAHFEAELKERLADGHHVPETGASQVNTTSANMSLNASMNGNYSQKFKLTLHEEQSQIIDLLSNCRHVIKAKEEESGTAHSDYRGDKAGVADQLVGAYTSTAGRCAQYAHRSERADLLYMPAGLVR